MAANIRSRVESLQEWIKQGKILEAMNEFYDPDVSMQENAGAPTVGLTANIEREKQFLAQVKKWKGYTVTALGVGDNTTFVENIIEFVNTAGQDVRQMQVAVQRWNDAGKITSEHFYYDASKK
ncbi:MAG: hypothetical protein KF745_09110 [Phycisphaeraceae bacterium]|nr:hypothetical protein [Phycisphaeraceae bacterium]